MSLLAGPAIISTAQDFPSSTLDNSALSPNMASFPAPVLSAYTPTTRSLAPSGNSIYSNSLLPSSSPWTGPTGPVPCSPWGPDDLSVLSDNLAKDWWSDGHDNKRAHGPHALLPPTCHPSTVLTPITPITTHAYTRADEILMHARMISLGRYQRKLRNIHWSHHHSCPLHLHNYAYHPSLIPLPGYRGSRRYPSPMKQIRVTSPSPLVTPTPSAYHTLSLSYTRSAIRATALSQLPHTRVHARPCLLRLGAGDKFPHTVCSSYILTPTNTRASPRISRPRTSATPLPCIIITPCLAPLPPPLHRPRAVTITNLSIFQLPKRILLLISFLFLILSSSLSPVHRHHDPVAQMPVASTTVPFPLDYAFLYTPILLRTSPANPITCLSLAPFSTRVWCLSYLTRLSLLNRSTPLITLPFRRDTPIPCNLYVDTLSEYWFYYPP